MGLTTRYDVLGREVLADDWGLLTRTRLRMTRAGGSTEEIAREAYDRGDGVAVLPYDPERRHVLLVRQWRWPAACNGEDDPHLIEAAAGLMEEDAPEDRMRAEAEEEMGVRLGPARKLFTLYSSPGSVTERLHYYVARYAAADVTTRTAGLAREHEETEVLDLPLAEALNMLADGRIRDAKTAILLQHAALHLMPPDPKESP